MVFQKKQKKIHIKKIMSIRQLKQLVTVTKVYQQWLITEVYLWLHNIQAKFLMALIKS